MHLDVGNPVLVRGTNHPGEGFSVMEAVAHAAGEAWSDRPRCASPAVTEWLIAWNDGLDDEPRQSLRRYIPRVVGSRGTRADERVRQWMAADWLLRWYTAGWLAAAGLGAHSGRLSSLPPIRSKADVARAWPTVRAAGRAARAERDQAWRSADAVVAAHDWGTAGAVWSAIADATAGAAGTAARAVVWSTTDPTAPGRVDVPAWDTACDAAADAAGAIAWAAVLHAARAALPGRRGVAASPAAAAVRRGRAGVGAGVAVGVGVGSASSAGSPGASCFTVTVPVVPPAGVPRSWLVGAGTGTASGAALGSQRTPTHTSPGGAGADLPVAHPPTPAPNGSGPGHHHSHEGGARSGRGCRVCTAEAGRAPRDSTCSATASVSGDQATHPPVRTSSGSERRYSSPVVETEPSAVVAPTASEMEVPDALAEAADPSESDDMWQLAWETARAVLAPTGSSLQASAHDLVDRLIAVTE
jgi:hypothetical protein